MKLEIPTGYRIGEIAYAAGILIDELVRTKIPGTQVWPHVRDLWIDHIRGKRPFGYDLIAQRLRVGYRGYLENLKEAEKSWIDLLVEEPKIIVSMEEQLLSEVKIATVASTLRWFSSEYDLREDLPPQSLVFSKESYAKEIVVFDSAKLGFH